MKIIKLRFKNLNSLVGEWKIDFSSPEYISDGIFAISGPTGSGKSTILDAICLALYGRTPRLKTITQSTNEIMSRQTGDCFSEVIFETNGEKYVSHWAQHRARKKMDGNLANPTHEISIVENGKVLASKLTESNALITELTGMDFNRFTQSMMLAQGGFAAFLQASANERAPILEQITGTEIYSEISKKVFVQQRDELSLIKQFKAKSEGIIILNEDDENKIKQTLIGNKAQDKTLKSRRTDLGNAINWIKGMNKLEKEFIQFTHEETALSEQLKEFVPQRQILNKALQAADFESDYATILGLRKQHDKETESLKNINLQLPKLVSDWNKSIEDTENKNGIYEAIKKEDETLTSLLKEVRAIDQNINGASDEIKIQKSVIKGIEKDLEAAQEKELASTALMKNLMTELKKAESYINEHAIDAQLVAQLTGIIAEIKNIIVLRKAISGIQSKLINRKLELQTIITNSELKKKNLQKEKDLFNQNQKEISIIQDKTKKLLNGITLSDYRNKKDSLLLELAKIKRVKNFDEERNLLKDDEPCFVCGSLHHPYAKGNIPETTQKDKEIYELSAFILTLEKLEAERQVLQTNDGDLSKKLSDAGNQLEIVAQQKLDGENRIHEFEKEEKESSESYNTKTVHLINLLSPFGVTKVSESKEDLNELNLSLTNRKMDWDKNQKVKTDQEFKITECKNKTSILNTLINEKQKSLTGKKDDLQLKERLLKKLFIKRKELFEDKNCDHQEKLIKQKVDNANQELQQAIIHRQKAKSNHISAKARVTELTSSTSERQRELLDKNEKFGKSLIHTGFIKEEIYLKARLPKNERDLLTANALQLDTKKIQMDTLMIENRKQFELEKSKNVTDEPFDILQIKCSDTENLLGILGKEIGSNERKLIENKEAKVRGREIIDKIEAQQKILNQWDKLNTLIGSADGKKYRNFAQGLTFEIMVAFANKQLIKLSGRYLLIRDKDKPLDLNVIDNYQAGEIRSTKNLSGGESFIVSLALALGLSNMSSKNVRVDSLFLDEGFGTLDEDTLETALATLAELRQDGKMIGLISHVGVLKDRINTKIIVQPIREGKSILSGPGCSQN